jgi:hypothetical protein
MAGLLSGDDSNSIVWLYRGVVGYLHDSVFAHEVDENMVRVSIYERMTSSALRREPQERHQDSNGKKNSLVEGCMALKRRRAAAVKLQQVGALAAGREWVA